MTYAEVIRELSEMQFRKYAVEGDYSSRLKGSMMEVFDIFLETSKITYRDLSEGFKKEEKYWELGNMGGILLGLRKLTGARWFLLPISEEENFPEFLRNLREMKSLIEAM